MKAFKCSKLCFIINYNLNATVVLILIKYISHVTEYWKKLATERINSVYTIV